MDAQVIGIHCFIPEGKFLKQQNYCHTSNTSLNLLSVRSPDALGTKLKTLKSTQPNKFVQLFRCHKLCK